MRHSYNPPGGKKYSSGFTLLEISIVLVIGAVLTVGGLVMTTAALQKSQADTTQRRMQTIEQALLDYSVAFTRIPCPSDLTLPPTDSGYGVEESTPGTCTPNNLESYNGAVEGGVPTRALQLPDELMYDGWGRRFRYAVASSMTTAGSLPFSKTACPPVDAITVKDSTGAARTTGAIYMLLSYGANGHGGYGRFPAGVAMYSTHGANKANGDHAVATGLNAQSTNTDELLNCHCDSSGGNNLIYEGVYVQKALTADSTNPLNSFDDILTYKEGWQMQTPSNPLSSAASYVYVADSGNNRIQEFTTSGVYAAQEGSAGSSLGQFNNPEFISVDSNGKQWISDVGNLRTQIVSACNSSYTVAMPQSNGGNYSQQTVFDSSGNAWMTYGGYNQIQELGSTAVWEQTWNSLGGSAGSAGNNNGQFWGDQGIAIDTVGNFWIAEASNNRVQKFSSSRSWLLTVPNSGCTNTGLFGSAVQSCPYNSTNGQFHTPLQIATDSGNNLWVADYNNHRIQKFDSNGNWLRTIGGGGICINGSCTCTSGGCSVSAPSTANTCSTSSGCVAGGNNTQFNFPQQITVDSSNNLWVADSHNNRIQEFDSNGNWLMSVGGGGVCISGSCTCTSGGCSVSAPSTANTCNTTSGCTSGSANSWFTQPRGIAVH